MERFNSILIPRKEVMTKLQEELTIVAGKTCEVGPKKSFFKFKPDFIRRIFKYIISLDLFSKNLLFLLVFVQTFGTF